MTWQPVADSVAALFARTLNPAPRRGVRFPEIDGDLVRDTVDTRHGATAVTIYRPTESPASDPAVYVNIHGGGFVVGHPEQDDPWCRYLAARAGVVVVNVDYVLAPHRRFPVAVEQI